MGSEGFFFNLAHAFSFSFTVRKTLETIVCQCRLPKLLTQFERDLELRVLRVEIKIIQKRKHNVNCYKAQRCGRS